MTEQAIQEQLDAMKEVSRKILKSREASLKFLCDAGIIYHNKMMRELKKGSNGSPVNSQKKNE
jgi:hypothetical protein